MAQRMQAFRRWLSFGIGIKRWLILFYLGLIIFGFGLYLLLSAVVRSGWISESLVSFLTLAFLPIWIRLLLPISMGFLLISLAIYRLGARLLSPFELPESGMISLLQPAPDSMKDPSIVVIGGGTGMPGVLRGLREYTSNITAIVTVADDGGSSGRLRREIGLLPPGDFRNNIAALSRDEALMTKVLQYRFGANLGIGEKSELRGHAFGNLLLAALTGISGSFDEALLGAEKVLAMRGRVLPSTLEDVVLVANIETSTGVAVQIEGESQIPKANGRILQLFLKPDKVRAFPPALKAIFQADLIILGPGSLYTSILPNLMVRDISEALCRARAPKLYICNLATQPGETDNYTVSNHVATILEYIPAGCLDLVLANNNVSVPTEQGGGKTIYVQPDSIDTAELILADLVDEKQPWRHNSQKLAQVVWQIIQKYKS